MSDDFRKVLFVTDANNRNERPEEFMTGVKVRLTEMFSESGMDILFDQLSVDFGYNVDAVEIMNKIDGMSSKLCMEDYLCVIAEGLAAWFWMQAAYDIPVICINPVLDPAEFFDEYIEIENFSEVGDTHEIKTDDTLCIFTDEFSDYQDDYEEFFGNGRILCFDGNVYSDEFIESPESELYKAISFVSENF